MSRNCILAALLAAPAFVLGALAQEQELREAARLDQQGKCEEAEPYYQRALASGEPSAALLNNVGNHYLTCGQPAKARPYFERLLNTNPAHPNANLQLARIATDQKQGAKALEHLARVNDSGPAVSLLRAEALYWSGKRGAALATLYEVEKRANGDPRVLFTLGLTCARIGLYEQAETAFSAVLLNLPGNFDALLNLGRAAARAENYERAKSALEAALKVRPGDVDALLELGLAHAAGQESSRAVFVLAQARQKAPKRPDILLALARAAEDAEYFGDAALAFDEYLELQPGDDTARRDRARVCGRTETRREEGLKELAWYIEKHAGDPRAHYDLAHLTWEKSPEQALEQLAAAVRLDPGFAAAHVSRAWLLQRLGRAAEAVPHLETAVRIRPNDLRGLDQLGLAYLTLDKPSEAEKFLRRALAISPQDPEVLLHLGRALMALDRSGEAESYLEKFQKVRSAVVRTPRTEAGMIELASLSAADRRKRQIDRFRRMSDSRPDDPELQLHLADLLLADGRISDALREFGDLLIKNVDSETRERAGKSLLGAEQYQLAREFLEPAAAERSSARLDFALALLHTAGPEQALRALEETAEGEQTGDYFLVKARILDAAGRTDEAGRVLQQGLIYATTRPEVARQAAIFLVRHDRNEQALDLLGRAMDSAPESPGLMLTKAIVLGLMNQDDDSESALRQIQSRWPEWDQPYLVQGLLAERQDRRKEATRKIQTAISLGSANLVARCALARLAGSADPGTKCECGKGLYDLLVPECSR